MKQWMNLLPRWRNKTSWECLAGPFSHCLFILVLVVIVIVILPGRVWQVFVLPFFSLSCSGCYCYFYCIWQCPAGPFPRCSFILVLVVIVIVIVSGRVWQVVIVALVSWRSKTSSDCHYFLFSIFSFILLWCFLWFVCLGILAVVCCCCCCYFKCYYVDCCWFLIKILLRVNFHSGVAVFVVLVVVVVNFCFYCCC